MKTLKNQKGEKKMKTLKNQKGFTLVELIVVIAIIGILSVVLIPSLTGYIRKAKESAALQEVQVIQTAYETFKVELDAGTTFDIGIIVDTDGGINVSHAGETFVSDLGIETYYQAGKINYLETGEINDLDFANLSPEVKAGIFKVYVEGLTDLYLELDDTTDDITFTVITKNNYKVKFVYPTDGSKLEFEFVE